MKTCDYDLILITETWCNSSIPDALLTSLNFLLYRCDRKIGRGGGVACLIRKNINCTLVNLDLDENLEIVCVDLSINGTTFRVSCMYSPPSYSNEQKLELFSSFDSVCSKFPTLIFGDFNEPTIDWSNPNPDNSVLVECSFRNGLEQVIDAPTRNDNILDLIFTNSSEIINNYSILPPFSNSDHSCIELVLNFQLSNVLDQKQKNFYKADYKSIVEYLELLDWSNIFSNCITANDFWSSFHDVLTHLIECFVPLKMPPKRKILLSSDLKALLRKKKKLWKRLKTNKNPDLRLTYNKCLRQIKKIVTEEKVKTETDLLRKDPKAFFKFVKQNLNLKMEIPDVNFNSSKSFDDKSKAQLFNEYFQSVFNEDCSPLTSTPVVNSFVLKNITFTSDEIRKVLKCLKPNLSQGPDCLPPIFLKTLADVICFPLQTIFEVSFRSHALPFDWLQSNVTAIHKKGPKHLVENYRPISLTCVCCKVMETIIKHQIMAHVENHKMLSPLQFGFHSGKSTSLQLLKCTDDWTMNLDKKMPTDVIYLDFAKAFDTVSHNMLFFKLQQFGITGDLLK